MNKFSKISYEQFEKDFINTFGEDNVKDINIRTCYDLIKLPKRATKGSAGYDFYSPVSFCLKAGETIKIPTGIRVELDEDKVLSLYPRSGLGFKYRLQLNNTVGVIDSDYYFSDNEGHIMAKITCDSKTPDTVVRIKQGDGFMQGIITQYYITDDDTSDKIRNGGFGSTDKQ